MATCTTIHLPTVLHFHPGSLATNQHFNMKLLTLSKGWCLFEFRSSLGLICNIEECQRVSWVDSTGKGTTLNGRRKYLSTSYRKLSVGEGDYTQLGFKSKSGGHVHKPYPLHNLWLTLRLVSYIVATKYLKACCAQIDFPEVWFWLYFNFITKVS